MASKGQSEGFLCWLDMMVVCGELTPSSHKTSRAVWIAMHAASNSKLPTPDSGRQPKGTMLYKWETSTDHLSVDIKGRNLVWSYSNKTKSTYFGLNQTFKGELPPEIEQYVKRFTQKNLVRRDLDGLPVRKQDLPPLAQRTAFHMAGHCVAAINLKLPLVQSVSSVKSEQLLSGVGCCVTPWPFSGQTNITEAVIEALYNYCIVIVSGEVAEEYFIMNYLDDMPDFHTPNSKLSKADRVFSHRVLDGLHKEEIVNYDSFVDTADTDAQDILVEPINWAQVEALSKEFLAHKTLKARQIITVCEKARKTYLTTN